MRWRIPLTVLVVVLGSVNAEEECPPGAIPGFVKDLTADCYLYERFPTQFVTAEHMCRLQGGNLASVKDDFVNAFIAQGGVEAFLIMQRKSFWIGAHSLHSNSTWEWVDDRPFKYTKWDENQPSNQSLNRCAAMHLDEGLWKAEDCFERKPYVCALSFSNDNTTNPATKTPKPKTTIGLTSRLPVQTTTLAQILSSLEPTTLKVVTKLTTQKAKTTTELQTEPTTLKVVTKLTTQKAKTTTELQTNEPITTVKPTTPEITTKLSSKIPTESTQKLKITTQKIVTSTQSNTPELTIEPDEPTTVQTLKPTTKTEEPSTSIPIEPTTVQTLKPTTLEPTTQTEEPSTNIPIEPTTVQTLKPTTLEPTTQTEEPTTEFVTNPITPPKEVIPLTTASPKLTTIHKISTRVPSTAEPIQTTEDPTTIKETDAPTTTQKLTTIKVTDAPTTTTQKQTTEASTTTEDPDVWPCPNKEDWYYEFSNNMCYYIAPSEGWKSDVEQCRELGSSIVSVHDEDENSFLKYLVGDIKGTEGKVDITIGLKEETSNAGKRQWRWIDGSPVDYTHWDPKFKTQPTGSLKCATYFTDTKKFQLVGLWKYVECDSIQAHFICQKEADSSKFPDDEKLSKFIKNKRVIKRPITRKDRHRIKN